MDLVIARSEGIVSIDNQPLAIDTSPVTANVEVVAYDCTAGAGSIEYNDRLRLLEPFLDVTPYAPFVNNWMTAAAVTTIPLTLAQAKRVKIGLVDGIFNSKRQLPITTQGYTWDASDQSMLGMQAAIAAWDVASEVTSSDAQFSSNINAMAVQTPLVTPAAASALNKSVDYIASYYALDEAGGPWSSTGYGVTALSGGDLTQQPNVHMNKAPISAPAAITGPPIDWPPLNSTVMVRLSMASMRALVGSIQQRRASLQTTRLTKTNEINSRTTIGAIISYDATAGWPF